MIMCSNEAIGRVRGINSASIKIDVLPSEIGGCLVLAIEIPPVCPGNWNIPSQTGFRRLAIAGLQGTFSHTIWTSMLAGACDGPLD